jgi:hypothetical protein
VCDADGKNCKDFEKDEDYKAWLNSNPTLFEGGGKIHARNDDGSSTVAGTVDYYRQTDIQAAQFIDQQVGPPVRAMLTVTLAFIMGPGSRYLEGGMPEYYGPNGTATVKDLLIGATPEGGTRTDIYSKPGGYSQARADFEALGGQSRANGRLLVKDLPNGQGRAVLRDFSTDGRPTLEIQPPGGGYKATAIRYNK